jgi:hypothetical protein
MTKELANNYEAARRLDAFVRVYIDPLVSKIDNAEKLFKDEKYKWKVGEKARAEVKYEQLVDRCTEFKLFAEDIKKLIQQHEGTISKLCDIYYKWYENIAYNGKQQREMMKEQVNMLQEIFTSIFEIIEPIVENELKAPDNE